MSAHVFTWRIDSLVYIRGSYKLGGMLLFSDAGQRRWPIVARGNTLSPSSFPTPPGDMGQRPIAFRNTLPFFFLPLRESDRRVIDSPIRPWPQYHSIREKNRDSRKRCDTRASKIGNNFCCLRRLSFPLVKSRI